MKLSAFVPCTFYFIFRFTFPVCAFNLVFSVPGSIAKKFTAFSTQPCSVVAPQKSFRSGDKITFLVCYQSLFSFHLIFSANEKISRSAAIGCIDFVSLFYGLLLSIVCVTNASSFASCSVLVCRGLPPTGPHKVSEDVVVYSFTVVAGMSDT